ncbi:hypothetical protein D3C71_1557810 [compost metagenome]
MVSVDVPAAVMELGANALFTVTAACAAVPMSIKTAATPTVNRARLTAHRHFVASKTPEREAILLGWRHSPDGLRAGMHGNIWRKQ